MENYTLNYYDVARKDYGAALQPVLNANTDFMAEAIRAFNSIGSNTQTEKISFVDNRHQQCLVDYILHEQTINQQKIYDRHLQHFPDTDAAKFIHKFKPSLDKSHTSLFRVVDLNDQEGIIYFDDILNGGKEYAVIDPILAKSYNLNGINYQLLTFFRFMPFLGDFIDMHDHEEEDITTGMSTGFMYFFLPNQENFIRKELERLYPLIKSSKKSSKRQIAFTELHKKIGQKMVLAEQ